MRKHLVLLSLILIIAATAVAGGHHSPLKSSPAFDKMRSLVGEWTATVPNMGKVTATYSLHSDGSALLEELKMPDGATMITVYYPAGNEIAMTHYCAGHNQPHMKSSGASAESIKFAATSVENLETKDADHMEGVQFAFRDADHFTATWMNVNAGKTMPMPLEFTRVR